METLSLFGPAAVTSPGEGPVPLRLRPKGLALLAHLALDPRPHRRTALADLIFPETADPRAELRWYLNHLRQALPARLKAELRSDADSVQFGGRCDIQSFREHGPLELFRGDLCADLRVSVSARFDTWLCIEQESLRTLFRRRALEFAASATSAAARERAVTALSILVSVDPYCEDAHVALVEGLEVLGRLQAADVARARYERVVTELGIEPRPLGGGRALPREDFVPVGNVTLHVVEWEGHGPPVIAVHGSAMSAYAMAGIAERAVPGQRLISVDLRGHGLSDKPPSGYHLEQLAGDLAGLIGAVGGPPPFLAGFSVGGAVATLAAARRPAAGLILLDAVVGDAAFVSKAFGMVPAIAAGIDDTYSGLDEYIAGWSAQDGVTRYARLELTPMPDGSFRRRALRAALEEMWASALTTDTLGPLASLDCPVLVVNARLPWRGLEPYIALEVARRQVATAKHGTLVLVPNRDHPGVVRSPVPAMVDAIRTLVGSQ